LKILLAPDKFKGTLSAPEVCAALAAGFNKNQHEIRQMPLADGGEGTQELFLKHLNGKRISVSVHDPLMRLIQAEYILSSDNKTAFIEMSSASGLSSLNEKERNPMFTTTFGTGELVRHALDQGVDEIYLGIGGSATNDAGLGMLCAMGARMLDKSANEFIPRGETLGLIEKIDLSVLHPQTSQVKFTALCDVENPLYGERGAAFVYAPQKGATPDQVHKLDAGLMHVASIIQRQTGIDLQKTSGAGAGGGIAGGLHALLHTNLKRGIDVVFEITRFIEAVQWADVVITGEGKVDEQTWRGKVISGVVNQARTFNKRVIIVCGQEEDNERESSEASGAQSVPKYSLSSIFGITRAMEDTRATLTELVYKMQLTE
jgi:glycerate kinase